jgi:hypothetical protein
MALQAKAQIDAQTAQREDQRATAQQQQDMAMQARQQQLAEQQAAMDAQMERMRAANEIEIQRMKAAADIQIERIKAANKAGSTRKRTKTTWTSRSRSQGRLSGPAREVQAGERWRIDRKTGTKAPDRTTPPAGSDMQAYVIARNAKGE